MVFRLGFLERVAASHVLLLLKEIVAESEVFYTTTSSKWPWVRGGLVET